VKFQTIESKTVVIAADNIDTDQIIPARYLKAISKEGLGEGLFRDWRQNPEARFPVEQTRGEGRGNSGCRR
jgi:3-isopropylmalate/(R)-2-methylmalate dehydratase small subunit